MSERQHTDVGTEVISTQAPDHALNAAPADVSSLPDPVQIPGLDSQTLDDTAIGDTTLTVSPGTLVNPSDPAENTRRAEILAGQESGPLSKFSELLSGIRGSKRFEGHLKEYAAVLGIGGTSTQDIRRFKIRAEKNYRRQAPDVRVEMEHDMKRNLELLIEDRFDADLVTIAALKTDAGIDELTVQQEGWDAAREFKPANRKVKTKILRSLAGEKKSLLISNYETYLIIWQDLNPHGVDIGTMRAAFEMAGSDRAQQLALAEKLYAEVSSVINQRAGAFTAQWKQLTIDQGLPSEMADKEAHLLFRDATTGSLVARTYGMQQIRAMNEELLLKTFGISSSLWAEISRGSLETQFDLDAAFESPLITVENKIKLAKGMYRRIDRKLKAEAARLFEAQASLLRKKGKLGELDITLKTHNQQNRLQSMSRIEQYRWIREKLRSLGMEPLPVPGASTVTSVPNLSIVASASS